MFKFNTYLERPFFKLNGVKIGRRVRMIGWPCIFRFPGSEIEIGDDCLIRSNFWSNLIGLYQRTIIIAKRGAKIKIGKNVGISGSTIYAWNGICWDEVKTAPVVIGRDCFIGCNSLILKGVTLGDGCVIGAGSVVTKDVPPLCVAAGNPARVVRKLQEE